MAKTRIIETLDSDGKTVNIWKVPHNVSLDKTIRKQDSKEFRDRFLSGQRPLK